MSEQSTDGTEQYEEDEIESLRENSETLHVTDVDKAVREEVRASLEDAVESVFELAGENVVVREVYVFGSYATGDGLPGISDLDVRVVVESDEMYIDDVLHVEEDIRTKLSPEIVGGTPFGFVDPKIVRRGSDAADGEVVL